MQISKSLAWMALSAVAISSWAQTDYKPKFKGDPAHSEAEAAALGYMRTVLRAEKVYQKRHNKFGSLQDLVHSELITRRLAQTDRGEYNSVFRSKNDSFEVTLEPKQFDEAHRSFYVDDDGIFRVEDQKPATDSSAKLQ